MLLECEDLAGVGVVLTPAADGAILTNKAHSPIAALAYRWSYRHSDGITRVHSFGPGTNPSVLLPFCRYTSNTIPPGGTRSLTPTADLEPVKLSLDSVFFADGGFAGPDELRTWDATIAASEAYLACAAAALRSPSDFFQHIEQLTGLKDLNQPMPPPHPPVAIQRSERAYVGWVILTMREMRGDADTIATVQSWAKAPLPNFHKLV